MSSDNMWKINILATLLGFLLLLQPGESIMCHRCYSAMGGCGHEVNWRMYPWRSCGDSEFCVKVMEKVGSEYKIIRECENVLAKSARHRLMMPVLRRHGYCMPARKNNPYDPKDLVDNSIIYCFCKDWNGCNPASLVTGSTILVLVSSLVSAFAFNLH